MPRPKWLDRLAKGGLGDIVGHMHSPHVSKEKFLKWAKDNDVAPSKMLLAYEFYDKMAPAIAEVLDSGEAGLVRDDLFEVLLAFVLEDAKAHNVLDLMHGVLSEKHYQMLQIAVAADNLRRQGLDAASMRLVDDAQNHHGADARKINALYSAGYILTVFTWQLSMKRAFGESSTADANFRVWFEEQLKFFDDAIFVNDFMEKDEIWSGIEKRMWQGPHPRNIMRVWAAGVSNINKTVQTLDAYIKDNKRQGRSEVDYGCRKDTYGKAAAVEFILFKVGQAPAKRSRLPMLWERDE